MPVFDFNATPDEKKPAECTYTVIRSNENEATIEKPMMILDNKHCKWAVSYTHLRAHET